MVDDVDNKTTKEGTNFNLDVATFALLGNLQGRAIDLQLKRKYLKALEVWQSIGQLIEPCIGNTESKKLERYDEIISKEFNIEVPEYLSRTKKFNGLSNAKIYWDEKIGLHRKKQVDFYSRYILRLMKDHKITLTGKEIKTSFN